jgi:hypothetical protein
MKLTRIPLRTSLAAAIGLLSLSGAAYAQGLMSTQGVVVATNGDTVPDDLGAPISGFTFSNLGDNCVLDESGNVFFRGRFVDSLGSTTTYNDRALFYGSSRATLKLVARGGDQAPGFPAGVQIRTASGSSTSFPGTVRISPSGGMWWGTTVWDSTGTAVPPVTSSVNDEVIYGGPLGAQTVLLRRGDAAPGTAGATFIQAFSSPSLSTMCFNRNGDCAFQGALTGGDVVGTSNQSGLWAGPPASLTMLARKGTALGAMPGYNVSATSSLPFGPTLNMNDAGEVLYEVMLDTTVGSPLPDATNDRVLLLHTPSFGSQVVAREGDVVPGPSGCTFNAVSGDAWTPSFSTNYLTRSGQMFFMSTLRGGDVIGTANDAMLFRGGVGTLAPVVRKGDAAPGTPAFFANFSAASLLHNDAGAICFLSTLSGGGVTTANDAGIWAGLPNALQLVLRKGDTLPGTGGAIASNINGLTVYFNDQNRVLFNVTLSGGSVTGASLWMWDVVSGLTPILLPGDQIEVAPSVFKTASTSFGAVSASNTDGASMHFGHDGTIGLRVGFSDSTNAIMVLHVDGTNPGIFCTNDSIGVDHTTPCPCGNTGLPGNGCGHSFDANGAHLGSSGVPLLDDVVLESSFTPVSSFTLFMQHDASGDTVFHDGVLCAGGSLIRLRGRAAVAGMATFPNNAFANDSTLTLSQRGSVTLGSGAIRYYAAWYRNASSTFCPPATANVTNGLRITW